MRSVLAFALTYLRINLLAAMEYRFAFFVQAIGMLLNDFAFAIFWVLYFARFPDVAGWSVGDLALIWAVGATSIGLSAALMGNCTRVATIVVQGQLDYYLGLPKDALLHVLLSRSGLAGWGDVAFGVIAYVLFGPRDLPSIALYVLLVALSFTVFVAFNVLVGCLGFWIGNAEQTAYQAQQALVNFSLYPGTIFQGWVRVMMFTVIPAGFITHVPVELLRSFDARWLAALIAVACGLAFSAFVAFRAGLRRYESGNLVTLRG
jgi:ABC-2 type transport system permease protein